MQRSYSFELFNSQDFFHDLFRFFKTLGLVVSFKTLQNFPYFGVFFDHKKFNRHKLWCPPECVSFVLFNYSSISYIDLALSYAETKLTKKTLIFHVFQGSMTFQACKIKFLNSMTFQVFHDLYKPCHAMATKCWFQKIWDFIEWDNQELNGMQQ